jgi:hypothetical protein
MVEALISRDGLVTRSVLLRSTPPYTQLVLDAIPHWRFLSATALSSKGVQEPTESSVLIAAVYRPPTFVNGPTIGESPKDFAAASPDAPYASALIAPSYPPKVANVLFAGVLFEVNLDDRGGITGALQVAADPGFETAARDALMQWRFRPATAAGRAVPSAAYVFFGFPAPVLSRSRLPGPSKPPARPSPPQTVR